MSAGQRFSGKVFACAVDAQEILAGNQNTENRKMRDVVSRVRVSCISPPIPIRSFDWVAWLDGDEERGPYGYGETEQDARKELAYQLTLCDEENYIGMDPMNYED